MQKTHVVTIDGAKVLGSPIVDRLVENQAVTERTEIVSKDGRQYRPANITRANNRETFQIVRAVPKVRGKAARKAEKRARHRNNNAIVMA